jgi:ABC-type multidrug transport system fused ATPase/permease subunit
MGLALWWTFGVWTATSWMAFPRFLVGVAFLFVLPGRLLVRWWRLPLSPVEHITLSALLGMVATSFLYGVVAWLRIPDLLWLWILAGVLGLVREVRPILARLRNGMPPPGMTHALLLLVLCAAWLPFYFIPFYYQNLAWTHRGGLTYAVTADFLLHTSVAAELTHTFPAQVPFMAGERLSYHIGMDLVAVVLNRYGGVSIADLVARFCPTLFVTVDVLAVFCLARRFLGSGGAGVAAAFLAVLGDDLSFIPDALRHSRGIWCAHSFQAPTVFSLYFVNPMAMAHGLLFASLFCLHRSLEDRRWGWIAAAALCSAALIQTKVFVFVLLVLALGVVLVVGLVAFRRPAFLAQLAGMCLAALPLALYLFVANQGAGRFTWSFSSGLREYVKPAFLEANWRFLETYPAVGLVVYLALTYGFRVLGLRALVRALAPSREHLGPFLLAVFVVLGPLLSLTTSVAPRDAPHYYNNAIWFLVASKYVCTLFAVGALVWLWRRTRRVGRAVIALLVAVASLPATVQYVVAASRRYEVLELSPSIMATIGFLNREARAGQVAVSPFDAPLLAVTGIRVPFFPVFADSFAAGEVIATRRQDLATFWNAWEKGEVREDLVARSRTDWIVSLRRSVPGSLSERDRIALRTLRLERVYANQDFVVHRVARLSGEAPGSPLPPEAPGALQRLPETNPVPPVP